jgi:hypothetical protein
VSKCFGNVPHCECRLIWMVLTQAVVWDSGLQLWICTLCDTAHENLEELEKHLCPGRNVQT